VKHDASKERREEFEKYTKCYQKARVKSKRPKGSNNKTRELVFQGIAED